MPQPWTDPIPPKKILAIRFQAMGDTVITLPYLQGLRNALPKESTLDLLTRQEVAGIPQAITLFHHVYAVGGGRNFKAQCMHAALLLPRLLINGYDAVLDLQNNRLSRVVRRFLRPKAWVEFDRFSPASAGQRNQNTIQGLGLGYIEPVYKFSFKEKPATHQLLLQQGWRGDTNLVILNPAGAFENRNWPLASYLEFARLWLHEFPETQFLMLGTSQIEVKARYLKEELGHHLVDLVGKTTPQQAFALVQATQLMVSEDSGLMHMGWVNGIPTLALFGSTRSDWARPLGAQAAFMDSSDMECGQCMQPICKFQDVRKNACITRYTATEVFNGAKNLLVKRSENRG